LLIGGSMIVLIIILAILFLLLVCPVSLTARYECELEAKIKYLFFNYKIDFSKDEIIAETKETVKEEAKKVKNDDTIEKIRDIIKQKGLSGFLNIIKEFASIATGAAKKLFSHMVIDNISTDIAVANGDAAETAILYGNVCAVVYTSVSILVNNMKCKDYHINIVPDFQSSQSRIRFQFKAHIMLLFLVTAGLSAFIRFLKVMKELKTTKKINHEKIKENKAVY
jgi:hypothetical protein